jgi:DNA-binding transcriptional LysR family regulator
MNPFERQQRPISTDMLTAFLKVAETRSVSQAALALDVGKGLVSKRIAQLEEKLGATLFSRSTRKIALTPAGEAYVDFARRALSEIYGGMERMRSLRSELAGEIRLTAPVSWGQRVLGKHLPEFLRLHPALEIELILADRLMDIASERIDIALRWSRNAQHEFNSTPLTAVEWVLAASPLYVSQYGLPASPEELAVHSCLYYRRDSTDDTWTLLRETTDPGSPRQHHQVKVAGRYRVDNPEAVFESAAAGLGVALLPDYLCENAIAQGSLIRVLPQWQPQTKFGTQVVALCTPERMKFTRNQALLEYLRAALAKGPKAATQG